MGLNTIFALIAGLPSSDALYISSLIFRPSAVFPKDAWGTDGIIQLINTVNFTSDFLVFIGAVLPPIVALIVASFLAENPKDAFGALTLSLLLSCGIYTFLYGIGQTVSPYVFLLWNEDFLLFGALGSVVMIFIGGIVNSFFYGAIAMFITKAGL